MNFARLDMLERGLFEAAQAAVSPGVVVSWAYGSPLVEGLGPRWASLRLFSGPVAEVRPLAAPALLPNVVDVTLRVSAAVTGARYVIRVNGYPAIFDATGADTVTTIRDALLGELAIVLGTENTAAALGGDSLTISQSAPGSIRRVEVFGPLVVDASTTAGTVHVAEVSGICAVEVTTFAEGASGPADDATGPMLEILGMFRDPSALRTLANYGIKPRNVTAPADLSDVTAGAWESRKSATVGLSIPLVEAVEVDIITDLALSLVVADATGATLETLQITQ